MILYYNLIGVNCALRAGDEHYCLRQTGGCVSSQFSFEINSEGLRCLVYHEDSITKTNQGGLRDLKKERKIVWIKPNVNKIRCPVRLVEKYLNLLPQWGTKPNFYLQSLKKIKPNVWYSTVPVGINNIRKVTGNLLKDAGLDGYFTNHSLRRTCATHLFQAGTDVKLIKEITGHVSDAVHKYQTTSDQQRMTVSEIIQGNGPKLSQASPMGIVEDQPKVADEVKFALPKFEMPIKITQSVSEIGKDPSSSEIACKVSDVIKNAVTAVGKRRAKVTIEVELFE